MKKTCLIVLFLSISASASAQMKFLPNFLRKMLVEKDTGRHSSIAPLPVFSTAPETGIEVGLSAIYSFYSDTVDRHTRVSNLFLYGTVTTKGQSRINLSTDYWLPKNSFHYTAGVGYINFPTNFYGIGSDTRNADVELIGQKRVRITFTGEKLFGKYFYLGFLSGFYSYSFTGASTPGIYDFSPLVEYRGGGSNVYLGPSLTWDSRNSNTYTTSGMLFTTRLSGYKGLLSSNNYTGGLLTFKYSEFFGFSKKLVLGYNIYHASLLGGQSPFYMLPAMGDDEIMRGYFNGRFRDRNYTAAQTELRYRISDRFGVVAFAGTGTVYHQSLDLNLLKPNYGGGLRYFFDVEKGLSASFDYGVGEQRPGEAKQSGFYIRLGEAF
jgi:hypothetical protein